MSELTERLRTEFRDEETRHIYADDFLNTYIASQLKVLREDRGWTQRVLAERADMRQERISVLEDVNYEAWSVRTLKRLAKAFDLRLSIKFESFGSFLTEYDRFARETLTRPSFEDDPAFTEEAVAQVAVSAAQAAGRSAAADDWHVVFSRVVSVLPENKSNVVNLEKFKRNQQEPGNQNSNRDNQLKRLGTGG